MNDFKTVSWFSAGVSSAVATKLMADKTDEIIYIHIDDQHPDTLRFIADCQEWIGKEIKTITSPIRNVASAMGFFASKGFGMFSPCTQLLKKRVRENWEREQRESGVDITYIWGMDCTEKNRADRIILAMPKFEHIFPLIEKKHKQRASAQNTFSQRNQTPGDV